MLQHVDQDDEDDHIDGKLKTREGVKEELFLVILVRVVEQMNDAVIKGQVKTSSPLFFI